MTESPEFRGLRKIPRYYRGITITEKIDGTNAVLWVGEDTVLAGSRTQWLLTHTPEGYNPRADNHGFAAWVKEHEAELREHLAPGYHYGEWYGHKINRGYGLDHKRLVLFNETEATDVFDTLPVLYEGPRSDLAIADVRYWLHRVGSLMVPGYMRPEGIVIYDHANRSRHKITLENDDVGKDV